MDDETVKRLQAEARAQLERDLAAAKAQAKKDPTKAERERFIFELGKARVKRKMSQAELAKRTGLQQTNISRIEHGKANPSLKTLLKITKALGVRLVVE